MMKKYNQGFTLVELLVAMAIIAILIALATFGINLVQRNSRDTQRRKIVSDIVAQIADLQANTFVYPTSITANVAAGVITFSYLPTDPNPDHTARGFNTATVTSAAGACAAFTGAETTPSNLAICYDTTNRRLGVRVEGGTAPFFISL